MVTHSDEGSFWSVVKKGAEQAAKDAGRQAHLEPVEQRPAEGGAADRRRRLAEGRRPRGVRPERRRDQGLAAEGARRRHPDHHAELRRSTTTRRSARSPTSARPRRSPARRPARSSRRAGVKKVLCVIHEQNNIGLQQRCDGVKKGFGGDGRPTCRSRAPRTSPRRRPRSSPSCRPTSPTTASSRSTRTSPPRPRRRSRARARAPSSRRSTSARAIIKDIAAGNVAVRRRPAAVPAGLPAGRVPEALQAERQHRRRRPARPDRPGLRRQEQRQHRREARRGGHALATAGWPARRRPAARRTRGENRDRTSPMAPPGRPTGVGVDRRRRPGRRRAAGEDRPDGARSCAARRSARCWPRSSSRSSSGPRTRCSCSSTASRTGPTSPRRSASRRSSSRC